MKVSQRWRFVSCTTFVQISCSMQEPASCKHWWAENVNIQLRYKYLEIVLQYSSSYMSTLVRRPVWDHLGIVTCCVILLRRRWTCCGHAGMDVVRNNAQAGCDQGAQSALGQYHPQHYSNINSMRPGRVCPCFLLFMTRQPSERGNGNGISILFFTATWHDLHPTAVGFYMLSIQRCSSACFRFS